MTVRKNFLFDEEIAEHLEKIAKQAKSTQTQVLKELIEEKYQEISKKQKLEAFYSIVNMPGAFVGKSVQSIKGEINV